MLLFWIYYVTNDTTNAWYIGQGLFRLIPMKYRSKWKCCVIDIQTHQMCCIILTMKWTNLCTCLLLVSYLMIFNCNRSLQKASPAKSTNYYVSKVSTARGLKIYSVCACVRVCVLHMCITCVPFVCVVSACACVCTSVCVHMHNCYTCMCLCACVCACIYTVLCYHAMVDI